MPTKNNSKFEEAPRVRFRNLNPIGFEPLDLKRKREVIES